VSLEQSPLVSFGSGACASYGDSTPFLRAQFVLGCLGLLVLVLVPFAIDVSKGGVDGVKALLQVLIMLLQVLFRVSG
jgi:hypothetical protein